MSDASPEAAGEATRALLLAVQKLVDEHEHQWVAAGFQAETIAAMQQTAGCNIAAAMVAHFAGFGDRSAPPHVAVMALLPAMLESIANLAIGFMRHSRDGAPASPPVVH